MQLYHLSEGGGKDQHMEKDSVLWSQFRSGNRDALALLYKEYRENLRKHGLSLCKDADLVNDSIHELFSRLWMHRERIGAAHNVRGYLYKSMDRILIAQVVQNKKMIAGSGPMEDLPEESPEQDWIDHESRKQQLDEMKKCLHSLPKCQREVIFLKFFNDLSYPQISEIMDMQVASVYNLASKAIEHMRQKMHLPATSPS